MSDTRGIVTKIVQRHFYLPHPDPLIDALTAALQHREQEVREAIWDEALDVARQSAKKSIAAKLDVAAAEILIRRLENHQATIRRDSAQEGESS